MTGQAGIPRRTVLGLGLAQLVSWGISYYLIGGLGGVIAADLGWRRDVVFGGFSVALLVMALASPIAGRLIDRHGGRRMMVVGALLNAAGLSGLAASTGIATYYAAWIALGVAMRLTLYDAAFAALARIAGARARTAMAQITLPGGLASTVFWPLGGWLAAHIGWRGALLVFAGCALATVPLHGTLPAGRQREEAAAAPVAGPASAGASSAGVPVAGVSAALAPTAVAAGPREIALAGALYATSAALAAFLNAGMSSHMIGLLTGLGVAASTSVWIATLRGVGQSSARLCEIVFGRRVDPLALNLLASVALPLCCVAGLFGGRSGAAALGFALGYGAANGLVTIARGTVPLVLFDPRHYGALVGRLLVASFVASAAAPVVYAWVIRRFGDAAALWLSAVVASLVLASAAWLWAGFRRRIR